MSNRRYLEIDSTYRNRKQYPNPSNFTVLIAQSGTRDAMHAYDPVSLAAPQKRWVPTELISPFISGTVDTPADAPLNTPGEFVICIPIANNAIKDTGYYVGAPIQIVTPAGETVQITSWNYLSSSATAGDCFTVTVTPAFSQIPTGIVTFLPNTTDLANGSVFIPDGFRADHYYVDCIIYNETRTNWRPIISYDGTTKLVGLNLSPQFGGPVTPGWILGDISRFIFIIFFSLLSSVVYAEENSSKFNVYSGMFDFSDTGKKSTLIGFQHQNEDLNRDTFLGNISPITGALVTADSAAYIYTGVQAQYKLGKINFTPSFAPGLYSKGDGKDLGHILEFKSELQISVDFVSNSQLGFSYNHLSNASLGTKNPGANSYMFNFFKTF